MTLNELETKAAAEFGRFQWRLLQLRFEKKITAADQLRLEGVALGQLGLITFEDYLKQVLNPDSEPVKGIKNGSH